MPCICTTPRSTISRRAFRLLCLGAALIAGATTARAADQDCSGYDAGPGVVSGNIALGRIGAETPRTFFARNGSDAKGCPNGTAACRDTSYLVPGDRVILSQTSGAFVCADFIGPKGADRAGWLPAAAVVREQLSPVALQDWVGTWLRTEASITIKPAPKSAALAIKGDATWGALEPDRVKRGAVNIGEIEGIRAPEGATLSFAMGDKETLPVDKGDDADTCKVWMRRLGPYLVVGDNRACGGMNVSFSGAYQRKP